jgi:O-antigen/teichoic acid export membrane protein
MERMRKSLANNALYNVIYQLINLLFPLISVGYVSRILAPEGTGTVAYAQNILSYFTMFAALGIPAHGLREIARCRDSSEKINRVFSELLILSWIATSVCVVGYLGICLIFFREALPLYLIVGIELLFCYISIDWFYQGTEAYGYITLRNILVKILSLGSLFIFVKARGDYLIYALIHSVGVGCNHCFNMLHARRQVHITFRDLHIRSHLRPILWLMASSVTAGLYNKVDVTMLGAMQTAESVAYYVNAHKLVSMILGLVTAVSAVFLPRLSYLYASDKAQFSKAVSDGLHIVVLLAVPACAGVVLVADSLMVCLFGEAFLPGAGVLRILSLFAVIKGVGDLLCYQTIISSGQEKYLLASRVAGGLANVMLNAVLIPLYAHAGAAAASVISEMIVNGMLLPRGLAIAEIRIDKRCCGSIVTATAVMVPAVCMVQKWLHTGVLSLIISVGCGVLVYALVLVVSGNSLMRQGMEKLRTMIACSRE